MNSALSIRSVSRCRAADDDQLGRLHQHGELSVLHEISAGHGAQHDDKSDDRKHVEKTEQAGALPASGLIGTGSRFFRRSAAVNRARLR
jgi:hypothetical protein